LNAPTTDHRRLTTDDRQLAIVGFAPPTTDDWTGVQLNAPTSDDRRLTTDD
jgi:hypothetical protein